jgi:hypothetical protein
MLVRSAGGYKHGSKITTPPLSRRPSGEFPCRNVALARAIIPYVARADPRGLGKARLAERVGFEPTVRFPAHTLSKRAP